MNKPHKHADLIKQWADGAVIQYHQIGKEEWIDTRNPGWFLDCEYRVKPVTRKYRVALCRHGPFISSSEIGGCNVESTGTFIRWLTDWIEYEV